MKLPFGTKVVTKRIYKEGRTPDGLSFPEVMTGITFELIGSRNYNSRYVNWPANHPKGAMSNSSWSVNNEMIDWDATMEINKTIEEKIAEMTL